MGATLLAGDAPVREPADIEEVEVHGVVWANQLEQADILRPSDLLKALAKWSISPMSVAQAETKTRLRTLTESVQKLRSVT